MANKSDHAAAQGVPADPAATQLRRELGFYTHEEVCGVLNVATGTGYNRRCRGDWPPSVSVGRARLYPVSGFRQWLARRSR